MNLISLFLNEMNREAVATRKILGAVPESKFDWQPNSDMNSNGILAARIAGLPNWIAAALTVPEWDMESNAQPENKLTTQGELMALFEKSLTAAREALVPQNEEQLNESWSIRNGGTTFSTNKKKEVIRHAINQLIHHRALLTANLRMMGATVPEIYGTAAGDPGF